MHEAQLVAFPAPTLDGFGWVTSSLVRARLHRRLSLVGAFPEPGPASADDGSSDDTRCLRTDTSRRGGKVPPPRSVVLGSYEFTTTGDDGFKNWAESLADLALPAHPQHDPFRKRLRRDIYEVSDVAMKAITDECTVVTARVQLGAPDDEGNRTKTVQHGPFYSEYLPGETLLAALVESASADHLDVLARHVGDQVVQVGGDETIGKGLMWCRVVRSADLPAEAAASGADR